MDCVLRLNLFGGAGWSTPPHVVCGALAVACARFFCMHGALPRPISNRKCIDRLHRLLWGRCQEPQPSSSRGRACYPPGAQHGGIDFHGVPEARPASSSEVGVQFTAIWHGPGYAAHLNGCCMLARLRRDRGTPRLPTARGHDTSLASRRAAGGARAAVLGSGTR